MSEPTEISEAPGSSAGQMASWAGTGVLVLVVAALIALWLYPVNTYVFLPGQALAVEPMIGISGYPPLKHAGKLYLTDVSLVKTDHLLQQIVVSRTNSGADIQPAENVSGGLSEKQFNQLNQAEMTDSIHQAEVSALRLVPGFHPRVASTGPKIVFIAPNTFAVHVLRPRDVVEYVNGVRVHRTVQVAPIVHRLHPGQVAHLRILRHKRLINVAVRTVGSTNGQVSRHGKTPLIGISMVDQFVMPIKISVNAGDIGGPSGGLMFALGIVERLEHRDLTHGCPVAGTGTLTYPGSVGAIGGAKQKVIAAGNAGAKYFFVPDVRDNVQPAMDNRDGVKVLPVKTLSQALKDLSDLKPCH